MFVCIVFMSLLTGVFCQKSRVLSLQKKNKTEM